MDWEPGGEAKDENCGAGSGMEPVALLSCVMDDRRAGPGMSVNVSKGSSSEDRHIQEQTLTLVGTEAQSNTTSLTKASRVAADIQSQKVILEPTSLL